MNIAILGAGAWGTALAVSLAARHRVVLWARDATQAASMCSDRRNSRYLPEVPLPESVAITGNFSEALAGRDLALIATPTSDLREVLGRVSASRWERAVIWACKGFEQASGRLPHEVASEVLGVSGRAMLQALVAGTRDPAVLAELAKGALRKKLPALRAALHSRFSPHHALLVGTILAKLDFLDEAITALQKFHEYAAGRGSDPFEAVFFSIAGQTNDSHYTFKTVTGFDSIQAYGKGVDVYSGGGFLRAEELFGRLLECNSSRVYALERVRAAAPPQ